LDCADNLDAFENLFLGIRLLHYQKPLKGLTIILGVKQRIDVLEVLKLIRYLLKKVTGQIFFVPVPGQDSYDVQELVNRAKGLNIKSKAFDSLQKAFDSARAFVDERDGLVCISGGNDLVTQYWKNRGIKKF
jgi:folylpolyglutamate synthase/dihydropteroate synthase